MKALYKAVTKLTTNSLRAQICNKSHGCPCLFLISASMTVEATLLLPLFLFFCLNVLSIIEMFRLDSEVTYILWQVGRQYAQIGYLQDNTELLSELSIQRKIKNTIGNQYAILKGGDESINCIMSKGITPEGKVILNANYQVSPIFTILGKINMPIKSKYYGHAWTGYEISELPEEKIKEEYVYVTETGTVYHKNRSCSYLAPSVQSVPNTRINSLKNQNSSKYTKCEYCKFSGMENKIYITDYGDRYHSSLTCPGLKRTVYLIKLSEVGSRHACSKCGGINCGG